MLDKIMISFILLIALAIKVIFYIILSYLFFAFAPLMLDIEPMHFNISLPESFDGPLRANERLSQAEHLFVNEVKGPESLAIWNGDVYTGVTDGRIIRIRNDRYKTVAQINGTYCDGPWDMEICGRPLGMRFDSKGLLYVIDAYFGLHTVNVTSGKIIRLMTSKKNVGDRRPMFLDDLVIVENKKKGPVIYMTDASNKWDLKHVFYTVGEHDESGRVIQYDVRTKNATVIMKNLGFPNGIEIADDKKSILVCEFNNRRIMRYYIKGRRKGQTDVFAFNLPGEPDNIRRATDPNLETYWVALVMGRNANNPSFALDSLSEYPKTRKALLRLIHLFGIILEYSGRITHFTPLTELGYKLKTGSVLFNTISHYGLAVELNSEGKIIQSLHSPDGKTTLLSEVREVVSGNKKILYLGSYANNYLGKLTLGPLKLAPPKSKTKPKEKSFSTGDAHSFDDMKHFKNFDDFKVPPQP